jgi:two-component system nitrate/nitrite response regulator NarL
MENEPTLVRISIISNVRAGRDALAQALAVYADITVLGVHPPDREALGAIARARPDAVLLDWLTARDETLLARLRSAGAKVIVLGVLEDESEVLACAASGVSGYIPHDASLDMVVGMIAAVVRGELVCSPRMAAAMFKRIASLGAAPAAHNGSGGGAPPLTPRETEIAALLEHGLSNKEIARSLGIRVATVKNHVHHILGRLQVRRRGEAALAHRQRSEVAAD